MRYVVSGRYVQSGQPFEAFVLDATDEVQAFHRARRDDLAIEQVVPHLPSGTAAPPREGRPPRFDELPPEVVQAQLEAAARERSRPPDRLMQAGTWLLGACLACLVIGRVLVRLFFPQMVGQGLTPETLAVLIPVWSVGGIGLLLIVVARLRRWFA